MREPCGAGAMRWVLNFFGAESLKRIHEVGMNRRLLGDPKLQARKLRSGQ